MTNIFGPLQAQPEKLRPRFGDGRGKPLHQIASHSSGAGGTLALAVFSFHKARLLKAYAVDACGQLNSRFPNRFKPFQSFSCGSRFNIWVFHSCLPPFSPGALKANQALITMICQIAKKNNATPAQIARAWLLAQKPERGQNGVS